MNPVLKRLHSAQGLHGYGLWEFVVMPHGLTEATQTCQRGLDEIFLENHDCVDNYVDDIIIYSDHLTSHKSDLRRVFETLKSAGFTLRGSKCILGQTSITHLGFHYSAKGVTHSTDKAKSVPEWPTPKPAKKLRSFLGLANSYRNIVPGSANIAASLNDLTNNKVPFVWTSIHQVAFDALH